MAGLREDKKQQTQINIIESAKKMFSEMGFQKASMIEIAKAAAVGTGTIYNYFTSKGALLLHIFSEETKKMQKSYSGHRFTVEAEIGLVNSVIGVLHQFSEFFNHYPKAFWRDLFHVMTEEVEESTKLRQGLFGLDEEMMKWIMSMIENEADCFLFSINSEEAAYLIYSSVMTDTMLYMYNEAMTYEQYKDQITRHIRFIFAGKIKPRNEES